jgi:uncharacterized protein (TIGR02145 family)
MKRIISLPIFQVLLLGLLLTITNSCTTEVDPKLLPVLTTTDITKITEATAISGGNISSDAGFDITARGVCWSNSPNPTIKDSITIDAAGSGIFVSKLSRLTANTTYYVRAYATNKKGTSYGLQVTFSTKSLSLITTPISSIKINSAISGGTVATTGDSVNVLARGICWGTQSSPTISNSKTSDGKGGGKYTSSMTDLILKTTYYVRAYVTNSAGTIYGNEISFTTQDGTMTLTTTAATSITATSVTVGGSVPNDGGSTVTERGICISKLPAPTITNKMANGSGTGSFATNITGLTVNTTYYVRAYATNSVNTSYGNEVSFTTQDGVINLSTTTVNSITINTAISGGTIISDGGSAVTTCGICWSSTPNPTTADNKTSVGLGGSTFSSTISGLSENTTYYVRSYATNSIATSYGNEVNFITKYTVKDIDGNVYNIVTIGTQVWLVENLKTTKYRNGESIVNVTDNSTWISLKTGAYCDYNNTISNSSTYGKMYNWYAVNDIRNIAPIGWHIPTDSELTTLVNFLGGNLIAGGKLKENGTNHWGTNTGATNESGFTALPGGYRSNTDGTFIALGSYGYWWAANSFNSTKSWNISMYSTNNTAPIQNGTINTGFSVRCIKD